MTFEKILATLREYHSLLCRSGDNSISDADDPYGYQSYEAPAVNEPQDGNLSPSLV